MIEYFRNYRKAKKGEVRCSDCRCSRQRASGRYECQGLAIGKDCTCDAAVPKEAK